MKKSQQIKQSIKQTKQLNLFSFQGKMSKQGQCQAQKLSQHFRPMLNLIFCHCICTNVSSPKMYLLFLHIDVYLFHSFPINTSSYIAAIKCYKILQRGSKIDGLYFKRLFHLNILVIFSEISLGFLLLSWCLWPVFWI